jgi:predicted nucleic acid-binding protein
MAAVFVDSFYFFALGNRHDPAHAKAKAFTQTYRGHLVTTEFVLLEWADGCASAAHHRAAAVKTVNDLRGNPDAMILPCTGQLFQEGLDLYAQRGDKEWSLTDCISFVVMQKEGITEALTGDHHFEQAGFVALLK